MSETSVCHKPVEDLVSESFVVFRPDRHAGFNLLIVHEMCIGKEGKNRVGHPFSCWAGPVLCKPAVGQELTATTAIECFKITIWCQWDGSDFVLTS